MYITPNTLLTAHIFTFSAPIMRDYNQAYIYKITNGVLDYYGSSADTFERRKVIHSAPSNKCTSKQIINGELPWTMEVIEWFPCSCVEELEDKEAWYIKNHTCVNENDPGGMRRAGGRVAYDRQRYQENRDERNANTKNYYQENKETLKAKANIKHNCDVCGGKFTHQNKKRHSNSKKHQRALAEAVATTTPPPPPTVINNITNNHCNITNNHK